MQKNEARPHTQKSTQWIKDLNIRPETIKLLEETPRRRQLFEISLGDDFLDLTPKAKAIKAKINKWVYTKL